jgi:hypothetical protein
MTICLNENEVRDALHCCSLDVTRENPLHQRYARGLLMGFRAAWLAEDRYLPAIDGVLRACLPEDVDPACFPENFRGVQLGGRFEVRETFNDFRVVDTKTGEEACMGDGVDSVAVGDDEYLSPGTVGFVEMWADDLNSNFNDTLEAYFPEQWAKESREIAGEPEPTAEGVLRELIAAVNASYEGDNLDTLAHEWQDLLLVYRRAKEVLNRGEGP